MAKKNYFNNLVVLANLSDEKFLMKEYIKLSKRLLYSMKEFRQTPEQNKKEMFAYNLFRAVSNTKLCEKPNFLRFKLHISKNIFAFWETIIINNYYQSWNNIHKDFMQLRSLEPRTLYYFDKYKFDNPQTDNLHDNIANVNVHNGCYKNDLVYEKSNRVKYYLRSLK